MEVAHTEGKKKGGFVKWAIVVAIVIVLNMFFNYGISLVYKMPDMNDFVKTTQVVPAYNTQAECLSAGGQWTDYADDGVPTTNQVAPSTDVKNGPNVPVSGYCDPSYTGELNYAAAMKSYDRNVFIILVLLGIISIILGSYFKNEILAPAFSWAGVFSLIIASGRYWSDANDYFKFIILAIALGLLIWVAIKRFGNK